MEKIEEQLIFYFRPIPMTSFHLDGTFYTILSVKPDLNPNKNYLAEFVSKNNGFIQVIILGENGKPVVQALLEVK